MKWKGKITFEARPQLNDYKIFTEDDNEIALLDTKATTVDNDLLMLEDSEDSFSKKKVAVSDLLIFGSQYHSSKSDFESSTTSTTYQLKTEIITSSLPYGTYYLSWYCEGWQSSNKDSFELRIRRNSADVLANPQAEPKDTKDRKPYSGFDTFTASGIQTFQLEYRQSRGSTAYIRNARLIFWRIL